MEQLARKEIGARIAQARREAGGMTQQELADLLGLTMRSVQGYELGEVVPWRYFERLEEIFKRPLGWFLHGEAAGSPPNPQQIADVLRRVEEVREELRAVREIVEALREEQPRAKAAARRPRRGS